VGQQNDNESIISIVAAFMPASSYITAFAGSQLGLQLIIITPVLPGIERVLFCRLTLMPGLRSRMSRAVVELQQFTGGFFQAAILSCSR
jgi:hypothetical protein